MSAVPIATKLDEFGKPVWIALMILAFIWWWPLGLAILAFMIGSGRMGCWNHNGARRWQKVSGNRAFDEYRADTLRRLEEEQREFKEFLKRLRDATPRYLDQGLAFSATLLGFTALIRGQLQLPSVACPSGLSAIPAFGCPVEDQVALELG